MWKRARERLIEWNVFEVVVDADANDQTAVRTDPRVIREQRIATRVYLTLLITVFVTLVVYTLLNWQTKVVIIYNPSLKTYQQLQKKHSNTLNCLCSTVTIPYKHLLLVDTDLHQICSSEFLGQAWISALDRPDASLYGALDFRTTASSQFELLGTLCRSARETIADALLDLNNTWLINAHVLTEKEIDLQTQTNVDQIRLGTSMRFNDALKHIGLSTRSSRISTALNTNYIIALYSIGASKVVSSFFGHTAWLRVVNEEKIVCRCEQTTCTFPAGFYPFADLDNFTVYSQINPDLYDVRDFVPGFVASCTPLEAILQATFVCLYEIKCIETLIPYFPRLAELPNIRPLNRSDFSMYPRDVTVNRLVEELFLERWTVSVDFEQYFNHCAPKTCMYSFARQADVVYTVTLLLSLAGGLQTILRFLVLHVVKWILRRRAARQDNTVTVAAIDITMQSRVRERLTFASLRIQHFLVKMNLFQSADRSATAMREQRISTRIFLCLLLGSLFVLLLFTTISEQTTSVTFRRPSFSTYQHLYEKYGEKLICPCSKLTLSHSSFVNVTPIAHPVCSSAFVQPIWFNQLRLTKPMSLVMSDWRAMSLGYFQSLAALCKLAEDTIDKHLQVFQTRMLVTTRLLRETSLSNGINETLTELIHRMRTDFRRVLNIHRLLFHGNQYFAGSNYNGFVHFSEQEIDGRIQIQFLFHGPSHATNKPACLCAFHPDCEYPMQIFHNRVAMNVTGFVWRCSPMDSILQSSLECLYTDCLTDFLLRYMNDSTDTVPVPPLKVSDLIRTSSEATVSELAEHLFVEDWQSSLLYENYFHQCTPKECHYTFVKRAHHLYVLTMFVAIYGGLTLSLRLLVPFLVGLIFRRWRRENGRRFCQCIRTKIVGLNLFRDYSFGKNLDRATRLSLGRISTRVYICVYLLGLIILILYTSIQQRTLTTTIDHPTAQSKQLELAECPCTRASIPYEEFVSIEVRFHPICNSAFVDNEWREALTSDLTNISEFVRRRDYRAYFSAHMQLLSGLCHDAVEDVTNTVRSFNATFLLTSRLLSRSAFDNQMTTLLHQMEMSIPTAFARSFRLAQAINRGNALMSVYASNYRYVSRVNRTDPITVLYTEAVRYSLGPTACLTPAAFLCPSVMPIKGLFIGCLPSESLLASTLECFFDQQCVDLLQDQLMRNTTDPRFTRLKSLEGHSRSNSTVNDLVEKLFMETWSTNSSYERYFLQCAPTQCLYSYADNANPLYVLTTLLGLYGGLKVVLSCLSAQFVLFIRSIYHYCQNTRRVATDTQTSHL